MRIALIITIGIHGIIHLLGFLKAFNLYEFNGISQPISEPFGIMWLLACILFIISSFLILINSNYWWITGIVGVILSQFLILNYWSDAKFGTIVNIIVLVAILLTYSAFMFKKKVNAEAVKMFENSVETEKSIVTKQMIQNLPTIVQKWLVSSGTVGKEIIYNIYLEQDLQMLMKPEQKDWNNGKAKQYFTTKSPAFNWSVNLKVNSLLNIVGRDKFENGKGEMIIKLFSLFSMANTKNNEKINQAALQRYLAEIVWFPSFALSPYITWETIDEKSTKATMKYKETKGSGIFCFDENGTFKKFIAMRYKDVNDTKATEWKVTATKTEERNGIKIPVELTAEWKLKNSSWTWLKVKITDIKYNVQKMPIADE
ncbi:DUF6920 family protein [Flavobacterium litorale]|uniref:Uncharacterized protein n=1 Tax=Flavobacterium litorale TaxID=2856519 RepID=A0ABX8V568_9FLAO|nr:DUF6544 family protein [Flavobacterium litorale]QYJ67940.1 hypothetical protein K1I41_10400 [Flavobacterium litorale]